MNSTGPQHLQIESMKSKLISQDSRMHELMDVIRSCKSLGALSDLSQLLDSFMAIVRERFDLVHSAVLLKEDVEKGERCFFQLRRHHGLEEHYLNARGVREPIALFRFEQDNGLLWQTVSQGGVIAVRNLGKEPRFKTAWERNRLSVLKSDVWCPLIRSGEVIGILALGEKRDGTSIEESDHFFIQELSSMAAVIIDSAIRSERNRFALENIRTLYEFNQTLSDIHDFDTFCRKMIENAVRAVNAQKGNLMMLNRTTGKLQVVMSWGHVHEDPARVKQFGIGEGAAGRAALERKAVVQNNPEEILPVDGDEILCICSVPVLNAGVLEGVMNFSNKVHLEADGTAVQDRFGRFSREEVKLLQGIADQSAASLHQSRLYSASITDRLTGLHNSRYFEETFPELVTASMLESRPLTLALLDIDHFKQFNDRYGHRAGDAILKGVAQLFSSIRGEKGDHIYRYGGEEFCVVFSGLGTQEAFLKLDEFRKKVENHEFEYEGRRLKVTLSIGIAECGVHSRDARSLFNQADEALYESKRAGRNQVRSARSQPSADQTASGM